MAGLAATVDRSARVARRVGAAEGLGLEQAWDGETRPCRSGNCAPTSLTLRGAQMDLGPPGLISDRPAERSRRHCSACGRVRGVRPCVRWRRCRRDRRHDSHHHASIGDTINGLLDSAGKFFSQLANLSWVSLLLGAGPVFAVPAAALAGAVQRRPRGLSRRARALAGHLGRVHGRLRGQQRVPARRRQHRAAVPGPPGDRAQQLSDDRRRDVDRGGVRLVHGPAGDGLRVHPGRVPQAAGLLQAARPSTSASSPRTCASRCSS